ncbi:unnamed protein product, partial [marine sediment metagenome]
ELPELNKVVRGFVEKFQNSYWKIKGFENSVFML